MAETKLSTCRICEAHCGLAVQVEDGRVIDIKPDQADPYSWRDFCIKGATADRTLYHPNRITQPMKRVGDRYHAVSWREAVEEIAAGLNRIRDRHGPNSIGVYGGNPSAFNTANSIFSAMFFNALGTKSRYFVTSIDNSPNMLALEEMIGIPWMNPIPDVDDCDYFLLLGLNPAISALNWGYNVPDGWKRILRRQADHGAQIMMVDPRRSESAAKADQHLAIRPGEDWAFLLGLIKVILERGLERLPAAIATTGLDAIKALAASADLGDLSRRCDIGRTIIETVARDFATARTALCLGHTGLSMQRSGTINMWLSHVLNAITVRLDTKGGRWANSGIGPWTQLLSAGASALPPSRVRGARTVAGFYPLAVLAEEITTPGEDQIRAFFVNAGNPVSSGIDSRALDAAFADLDMLIAVDLVQRESHRHAHWLIPGTHMFEREDFSPIKPGLTSDHFVSIDRQVVNAPVGMWPEWAFFLELGLAMDVPLFGKRAANGPIKALRRLGRALGKPDLLLNPRTVWKKMVKDGGVVRWREIAEDPRRLSFKADKFGALKDMVEGAAGQINLAPDLFVQTLRDMLKERSNQDSAYPLTLISRRTKPGMNSWLWDTFEKQAADNTHVEVNNADADALGIQDGDAVTLTSSTASITLRAAVSERNRPGVLSAAFGMGSGVYDPITGALVKKVGKSIHNTLISSDDVDRLSHNAGFNGVRVRLAKEESEPL